MSNHKTSMSWTNLSLPLQRRPCCCSLAVDVLADLVPSNVWNVATLPVICNADPKHKIVYANAVVGDVSFEVVGIYIVDFRQFLEISLPNLLQKCIPARDAFGLLLCIHVCNSSVLVRLQLLQYINCISPQQRKMLTLRMAPGSSWVSRQVTCRTKTDWDVYRGQWSWIPVDKKLSWVQARWLFSCFKSLRAYQGSQFKFK